MLSAIGVKRIAVNIELLLVAEPNIITDILKQPDDGY